MSSESIAVATGSIRAFQFRNCIDSSLLRENNVGVFILESNGDPSVPED
jgi:hypothetical protein